MHLMFCVFVQAMEGVLSAYSLGHNFGDFDFAIDDVEERFASTDAHRAVACGSGQKRAEVPGDRGIQMQHLFNRIISGT